MNSDEEDERRGGRGRGRNEDRIRFAKRGKSSNHKHLADSKKSSPQSLSSLGRILVGVKNSPNLSANKQVGNQLSASRLTLAKSSSQAANGNNNTCSICLNTINDPAVANNCLHSFCQSCIVEWARRSNQCPVCRTSFSQILINIRSDNNFDTIPVEQPRPAVFNIVREVTVSPDGQNATIRTRYSTGSGVQEVTEVRNLNDHHNNDGSGLRVIPDHGFGLDRGNFFDVFFRDIMNNQYYGGHRFPHNPTLRAPFSMMPGFIPIVQQPSRLIGPPFPVDPRAPASSVHPPPSSTLSGSALNLSRSKAKSFSEDHSSNSSTDSLDNTSSSYPNLLIQVSFFE